MPASFVFFVLSLGSLSGANLKKRSSAEMLLLRSGLHKRSAQAVSQRDGVESGDLLKKSLRGKSRRRRRNPGSDDPGREQCCIVDVPRVDVRKMLRDWWKYAIWHIDHVKGYTNLLKQTMNVNYIDQFRQPGRLGNWLNDLETAYAALLNNDRILSHKIWRDRKSMESRGQDLDYERQGLKKDLYDRWQYIEGIPDQVQGKPFPTEMFATLKAFLENVKLGQKTTSFFDNMEGKLDTTMERTQTLATQLATVVQEGNKGLTQSSEQIATDLDSSLGAADAADTAALDDLTAAATSTDADAATTGTDIGATHQTLQVLAQDAQAEVGGMIKDTVYDILKNADDVNSRFQQSWNESSDVMHGAIANTNEKIETDMDKEMSKTEVKRSKALDSSTSVKDLVLDSGGETREGLQASSDNIEGVRADLRQLFGVFQRGLYAAEAKFTREERMLRDKVPPASDFAIPIDREQLLKDYVAGLEDAVAASSAQQADMVAKLKQNVSEALSQAAAANAATAAELATLASVSDHVEAQSRSLKEGNLLELPLALGPAGARDFAVNGSRVASAALQALLRDGVNVSNADIAAALQVAKAAVGETATPEELVTHAKAGAREMERYTNRLVGNEVLSGSWAELERELTGDRLAWISASQALSSDLSSWRTKRQRVENDMGDMAERSQRVADDVAQSMHRFAERLPGQQKLVEKRMERSFKNVLGEVRADGRAMADDMEDTTAAKVKGEKVELAELRRQVGAANASMEAGVAKEAAKYTTLGARANASAFAGERAELDRIRAALTAFEAKRGDGPLVDNLDAARVEVRGNLSAERRAAAARQQQLAEGWSRQLDGAQSDAVRALVGAAQQFAAGSGAMGKVVLGLLSGLSVEQARLVAGIQGMAVEQRDKLLRQAHRLGLIDQDLTNLDSLSEAEKVAVLAKIAKEHGSVAAMTDKLASLTLEQVSPALHALLARFNSATQTSEGDVAGEAEEFQAAVAEALGLGSDAVGRMEALAQQVKALTTSQQSQGQDALRRGENELLTQEQNLLNSNSLRTAANVTKDAERLEEIFRTQLDELYGSFRNFEDVRFPAEMNNASVRLKVERDELETAVGHQFTAEKSQADFLMDNVTDALENFKVEKKDLLDGRASLNRDWSSLQSRLGENFTQLLDDVHRVGSLRQTIENSREPPTKVSEQLLGAYSRMLEVFEKHQRAVARVSTNESKRHQIAMSRIADAADSDAVRTLSALQRIDDRVQSVSSFATKINQWARDYTAFEGTFRSQVNNSFDHFNIDFTSESSILDSALATMDDQTRALNSSELATARAEVDAVINATAARISASVGGLRGSEEAQAVAAQAAALPSDDATATGAGFPAAKRWRAEAAALAAAVGDIIGGLQTLGTEVGKVEGSEAAATDAQYAAADGRVAALTSSVLELGAADGPPLTRPVLLALARRGVPEQRLRALLLRQHQQLRGLMAQAQATRVP